MYSSFIYLLCKYTIFMCKISGRQTKMTEITKNG